MFTVWSVRTKASGIALTEHPPDMSPGAFRPENTKSSIIVWTLYPHLTLGFVEVETLSTELALASKAKEGTFRHYAC